MKRALVAIAGLLLIAPSLWAQEVMYLHQANKITLGAQVSRVDSTYFNGDGSAFLLRIEGNEYSFPINGLDSITFGPASDTVKFIYENESVSVVNPLAFEGVNVEVEGAFVIVNATTDTKDINFKLSGNTENGTFKIYTSKRFNLILSGLSITNPQGPAINVQSKKKTTVILADETINTLTDGTNYTNPPNDEDQKGAFFSEATLVFKGNGTLIINGKGADKHGLCSDDDIQINGGHIVIASAKKDGVHAKDGLVMTSGNLEVNSSGDGIDAKSGTLEINGGAISIVVQEPDFDGLCCDSTLIINGGSITITANGDESKAIKSKQEVILNGGDIAIHASGNAVLKPVGSGYKPSYCTAIKSNGDVVINGANIAITSTGKGGKGISADANIIMITGEVNITSSGNGVVYTDSTGIKRAYVSTCLTADNDITLLGGTLTTSSSGVAGKGMKADNSLTIGNSKSSPTIHITTTGARLLVSGWGNSANYAEAKAIKVDADVVIDNGDITINSADDGIKALNSITINNCTLNILNSYEGVEAPFITFNGGNTHIKSSDDCINSTFGYGGEPNDGSLLTINDGYIMTSSTGGDGIDCNGNMLMTGGTVVIHGPPQWPEVGLDYNGVCNVNGGFMVISGYYSMLTQAPSPSSEQYSLKIFTYSTLSANTLFHIQHSSGEEVVTFQPSRTYTSIIFSSSALQSGESYSIYTGGSHTGTMVDGLYSEGTYSGGTHRKTFTVTGKVTTVNF